MLVYDIIFVYNAQHEIHSDSSGGRRRCAVFHSRVFGSNISYCVVVVRSVLFYTPPPSYPLTINGKLIDAFVCWRLIKDP